MQLENPFPVTTYHGAEYFCDRVDEVAHLISNIQNGSSTTLISRRRIGKTGLIKHTLAQLPGDWRGVYIDILETENMGQFLNVLSTSILQALPEKNKLGKSIWTFVKSLRPTITFDALSGEPQASFNVKPAEVAININSVLEFLEKQDCKIVIAIDEFQQIVNYPEKNTEAWLRTRIQQLKNVVFIFSGSQQHLMTELFTLPSRPFFRSTAMMQLGKIDRETYASFIVETFGKHNKIIDIAQAREILEWTDVHTYYVQLLCNRTFAVSPKTVKAETWKEQAHMLLKEQEAIFFSYRNLLTQPQWQLLKAIAHEGEVRQPTSKEFINKHNLGSPATILRSLQMLQKNELVFSEVDSTGTNFYSVYDVFFQRWAQSR